MSLLQYKQLHVHPAERLNGSVVPPASKSSSARAILAAALAPGTSTIENVSDSNNVRAMMKCCEGLGARLSLDEVGTLTVIGTSGRPDGAILCPGNSGIVLRLLLGVASAGRRVTFVTPYLESLGQRSNTEMLSALTELGVQITSSEDGRVPITLDGTGLRGGSVKVSGRRSSQFLSGLLYLGGLMVEPLTITVLDELKARPMVRTTLDVLGQAGVRVKAADDLMHFEVDPQSSYQPAHFTIGTDPASTAALLALAGSVESSVNLGRQRLEELGGVVEYLREMGVSISDDSSGLRVRGGGELRALDFDGSKAPDAVLPLAALAAQAHGTSRFYNIEHLRYKECDRISDFRHELEKAGVRADEKQDELVIHGSPERVPGGVVVDSHYDHGIVLAMSVVAMRSRHGLTINDPQYVAQTYPGFFEDFECLGGTVDAR